MLARDIRRDGFRGEVITSISSGCSIDSDFVAAQIGVTANHFAKPFSRYWQSTENKFISYQQQWKTETAHLASMADACMNPFYQKIIGLGYSALPYIFRDLEEQTEHWFWALKAITGEDPVLPSHRGDLNAIRSDWLEWGRTNGFI